ncbi:response regulator transcription factor [Fusibacter ferrireducens]|uniref:Stage 0 sporulation protein A homolog n=1 Tax=Fusibacter ferrireducens TaxID=2785058 RepID=A0ABR9ZQ85_9FIRM|nr:response regulator transcription factor [Fusibacter ferrireducens]MBF4692627.1 response regulator transcription factor [Fusibacter ferrireducens]
MYSILVVEDHREISNIVLKYLENEGYQGTLAENGIEALEYFNGNTFHLVLLDIMMPGVDGFQVLSEIRKISDIPVIMLTAKQEEVDKLRGFDQGADDYVIKPFSPRELMRRIKALLKRTYPSHDAQILSYGNLELDLKSMKLFKDQHEIMVTTAEFLLIKTFIIHQEQVLSREQIMALAFGEAYDGYDRNIDSYVKRLRQKIEDDPKEPMFIHTKYGIGYVFGGKK